MDSSIQPLLHTTPSFSEVAGMAKAIDQRKMVRMMLNREQKTSFALKLKPQPTDMT